MSGDQPSVDPFDLNQQVRQLALFLSEHGEESDRVLAMSQLYDLTCDRLVRYSLSITQRAHDAEDAVSGCILKVTQRPELLTSADQPWHYLLRMVRNESLITLRSRKRWSALGMIAQVLSSSMVDVVELDDQRRMVWQALERLPGEQREVIVLKIWEQLTFAEVAHILQLSPSTVASRYRYAMEKLSNRLSGQMQAEPSAELADQEADASVGGGA